MLAADIGQALGRGAHLAALRRTVVGDLDLAHAVTLAELESLDEAGRAGRLQPVDALLQSLPVMALTGEAGGIVRLTAIRLTCHRVLPEKSGDHAADRLIGVGEPGPDGRLWPKRLVQLAV